jgi:hypothetical protein
MNPLHLYIAAIAVASAEIAAPFAYDALREVYPQGELGYFYDKCAQELSSFDRWDSGSRALCKLRNIR